MSVEPNALMRRVLDLLQKVRPSGQGWMACCPAHDDGTPSLSVNEGDDGRVLLKCHAGCATDAILSALGLQSRDLFADDSSTGGRRPGRGVASRACGIPASAGSSRPTKRTDKGSAGRTGRIVARYPYGNATGDLLFEVVRYEPKDFRQRRPDGRGGWIWNLNGTPRVLYRLPELIAADPRQWVFVCEGEKDVHSLAGIGLTATCNPGGAGKWGRLADYSALHDRRVVILPDCDTPGRKHAQDVAARLYGKAAAVRVLDLAKIPDFTGKDVFDWIDGLDAKEPEDLARALLDMAESAPAWQPESAVEDTSPRSSAVLICLADVRPERVCWLWPSRIPRGKLTILAGDPGLGKSLITLDIAARVSTGTGWPDGPTSLEGPSGVVMLSAEDDPGDTIRPRLDAAEAEVGQIRLLEAVRHFDSENGAERREPFSLAEDLEALADAIQQVENCRLVIVDPISAYLGATDSHKNADVRGLLMPLSALAARHGVAVLAVTHLRKGDGAPLYRAMGSLAFVAAARSAYVVGRDSSDPTGERRFMVPMKNNLANDHGGLAYRLSASGGVVSVQWEPEPVAISADDVLAMPQRQRGPDPTERNEAADWLSLALANGARPVKELFAEARAEGISKATLRRAKTALGVIADKGNFGGGWTWRLREGAHVAPGRQKPEHLEHLRENAPVEAVFRGDEETQDCEGAQVL